MNPNNCCIVSVGVNGWYPTGINRLERSLNFVGWAGGQLLFRDYPEGSPSHQDNPYAFKIYAIKQAIDKGYTHILWLDASFYAVKNPIRMFDLIEDQGLYYFRTGYNFAETATDALLASMRMSRDKAETIPEFASGCVGFNLNTAVAQMCWHKWEEMMRHGLFRNSRTHDPKDSEDPRFRFGRQDQSALTGAIIHSKHDYNKYVDRDEIAYFGSPYNEERVTLFIQGL